MKITVAAVGKQKFTYLQEAEQEYLSRIQPFAKTELVRIKETTSRNQEEWFLGLAKDHAVIVLDEKGKSVTSKQFSSLLRGLQEDARDILFVIGGHDGVPKNVAESATYVISLSKLTFTHLMVPTILLEQLYRGFTLLSGHPYHRE